MENDDVGKGKRDSIIKAAEEIFAKKGFFYARVEEIAKEAGVGKGTVYEYFDSKEELFKEMMLYISSEHMDVLSTVTKNDRPAAERIKEVIRQHLNFMDEHKGMARILLADHFEISESLREWLMEKQIQKIFMLQELLKEGVSGGEFREDIDTVLAAHLIFGSTAALGGGMALGKISGDAEVMTEKVMSLILYGISKQ